MLHHGLTTDIDNERHGGPDRRDIGKVLLRADAKVHAASDAGCLELSEDSPNLVFVRREVVDDAEVASRLGNIGYKLPEVRVAEPFGERGCLRTKGKNRE